MENLYSIEIFYVMCPLIWKFKNTLFYKEIVEFWSEFSFQKIDTNSTFHSESLWYNSHIRMNNVTLFIREFHCAGINKVGGLYESDGKLNSDGKLSFDQLSQNNIQKMSFKWKKLGVI